MAKKKPVVIKRDPVESSNIKSVGYDKPSRTLEIEFNKGNVYRYDPVTEEAHRELVNAESIGKYFHQNIKSNELLTVTKVS